MTVRIAALESTPLTTGVSPLSGTSDITPASAPAQAAGAAGTSFESIFASTVEDANRMSQTAETKVQALASGAIDDIHGTMISVKQADISIKLVGSIRNKLLDAFNELWRTSV